MDAVIIIIHRALLSRGKPLLLVKACSKAGSSLAPWVSSLGLLHSTQLITAIACLTGEPEVLAEVWGAEYLQHQRLLL